ncbi:retrovirus-related pol polyprotein from transposon TNT 1-94 [Tanacetum coccineum]
MVGGGIGEVGLEGIVVKGYGRDGYYVYGMIEELQECQPTQTIIPIDAAYQADEILGCSMNLIVINLNSAEMLLSWAYLSHCGSVIQMRSRGNNLYTLSLGENDSRSSSDILLAKASSLSHVMAPTSCPYELMQSTDELNTSCQRQLDVKTSFMNGILREEVYVSQPDSYDVEEGKIEYSDPVDTPMVEKSKLDEDTQGKSIDPTHYLGMVGTLMYLATGRPDLTFAVMHLMQTLITRVAKILGEVHLEHSHSKHIDIRFHFIKEQVENGVSKSFIDVNTERQTLKGGTLH